jgi:heme oxygenase (biliverdin-producing, ferredoxin)
MTVRTIHDPDNCGGASYAGADAPADLTGILRIRTQALHTKAERSGVINDILRGQATRYAYAMLLRNLLPAYQRMEQGLEQLREKPGVGAVARREVYRAEALQSDLQAFYGDRWDHSLPLLPEGEQYGRRVAEAANGDGVRLIAHAYTRYLGDLSGGQIMKRMLARLLKLEPRELSFHEFPGIADADAFKRDYRHALNRAAAELVDVEVVIEEAMVAFELNIAVSEAVQKVGAVPPNGIASD